MKEGFCLFRVFEFLLQRNFNRETCKVHLPDFESKSSYEISRSLYKNLSARSRIFSIFCKELAGEKYRTKRQYSKLEYMKFWTRIFFTSKATNLFSLFKTLS